MIQRCAKTKRSGTANRLSVAKGTFLRLQLALLRWQFVRFCVGSSRFCVGSSRFCVGNLCASVLAARASALAARASALAARAPALATCALLRWQFAELCVM